MDNRSDAQVRFEHISRKQVEIMMEFFINPATAFICIALAMIFFRKEEITVKEALMLPLRRAALNFKPKFTDVFTLPGILLLITGSLLALLDVALF